MQHELRHNLPRKGRCISLILGMLFLADTSAALGPSNMFRVAVLKHASASFFPHPNAFAELVYELQKQTSVEALEQPAIVDMASAELFFYPFAFLSGKDALGEPSAAEVANLRKFLRHGGFLLIDDASTPGDDRFHDSVAVLLRRLFPKNPIQPLPKSHTVFRSFFLLDVPVGQNLRDPSLYGIDEDGRTIVLYTRNNLAGAWDKQNDGTYAMPVLPGGEQQREHAFRLGINIAMYALCLDYKKDQVHVKFLLKKRRWRVE